MVILGPKSTKSDQNRPFFGPKIIKISSDRKSTDFCQNAYFSGVKFSKIGHFGKIGHFEISKWPF
jgi:hypothetical protein